MPRDLRDRTMSSSTTIDDIPESLVVHILSFLYIQDAIRTSLVSRKFRNLWHYIPSLHFDISEHYSRSTSPDPRSKASRQLFSEFVYRTLFLRPHYPLTKFVLTFEFKNKHHYTNVQNWIWYAVKLSVSQLVLAFNHYKFDLWGDFDFDSIDFDFHLLDIRESCIKVLKLYSCLLVLPPKTNPIKFVSLESLELDVRLGWDNGVLCDLLARCVNLKTLRLEGMSFYTWGCLRIHSSSLNELHLASDSSDRSKFGLCLDVDICCPSLQKISLMNLDFEKYTIKDTTLLVEACVDCFHPIEEYNKSWEKMLSCFTNISSLHVWNELLASDEIPAGCEQLLPNVKHLELYCDYNEHDLVGVATLLKLLPKLEILGLHNRGTKNAKLHQDDLPSSTVFNMPCLRKVILRKYCKTKREQHFIKLFRKSGTGLERIELLHIHTMEKDIQRMITV